MLKVLVADDEVTIRTGMKKMLQSFNLDLEIVAEAADGEIALNLAKEHKPDIMLVDINMPFLSGLDFLEQIQFALPDTLTIIISGYDEFEYARKALQLRVFDYLLKPIDRKKLYSSLLNAVEVYAAKQQEKENLRIQEEKFEEHKKYFQEQFLKECVENQLAELVIKKKLDVLQIKIQEPLGLFIINDQANTLKEYIDLSVGYMFYQEDYLILVVALGGKSIEQIKEYVNDKYFELTGMRSNCSAEVLKNGIYSLYTTYLRLEEKYRERKNIIGDVAWVIEYLNRKYSDPDLTLQSVADQCFVSSSYLTRMMRQKLGLSFIEYLTEIRITKAIELLERNDDSILISDIANTVGYNSQHYFSRIFKQKTGLSPKKYKEKSNQ